MGSRHANTQASFPPLALLTSSLPSPGDTSHWRGTDRVSCLLTSLQWVGVEVLVAEQQ